MSLMGVVIVTYNSEDHITTCLDSLLASDDAARLRVVVIDNASSDMTVETITKRFQEAVIETVPETRLSRPVTLVRRDQNLGFANGVNVGLRILLRDPEIDRFWLLNPDTRVPLHTASRLMSVEANFGLLGNRICYADGSGRIQLDAGKIDVRTGVTKNIHIGEIVHDTRPPDTKDIDFVSGASLVASRSFVETVGLMPEDYFLYYEEVDWALRSTDLPILFCDGAEVFHIAGASIGSPSLDRSASVFSLYQKHRSRMIFLRRWFPSSVPTGLIYGCAKAFQESWKHGWRSGMAVLAGQFGWKNPFDKMSHPTISASSDSSVS